MYAIPYEFKVSFMSYVSYHQVLQYCSTGRNTATSVAVQVLQILGAFCLCIRHLLLVLVVHTYHTSHILIILCVKLLLVCGTLRTMYRYHDIPVTPMEGVRVCSHSPRKTRGTVVLEYQVVRRHTRTIAADQSIIHSHHHSFVLSLTWHPSVRWKLP